MCQYTYPAEGLPGPEDRLRYMHSVSKYLTKIIHMLRENPSFNY